ncbi:MAG: hypothetical protein ACO3IN_05400 [Steroidobacteraceae bacterium]|jgi:hypothetical protein
MDLRVNHRSLGVHRARVMTTIDPIELLVLWWRAESDWTPVEGYPVECPSTRGWRASRQYDDANGAMETDERGMLIRHISRIVNQIDEPYRTALYLLAKNRATGSNVWTSERLPQDPTERANLVTEALDRFMATV